MVLHRAHREDVVVDVDLELELVAEQALQLHDVEEDRAVLHGADEDRHAVAVAGREQRRLFTPSASSICAMSLAEQAVELGRRHLPLELGPAEERAEEPVGVEQRLLPEAEIVDADDAREADCRSPAFGFDLADAVADDAVGVVVEVRAGRRDAVDDAALDERDEAATGAGPPASSRPTA